MKRHNNESPKPLNSYRYTYDFTMEYARNSENEQKKIEPLFMEGVIVCVNYSDFLAHTLPSTRTQFDRLVVVTDTKDLQTKKICDYYNVECVQTDVFYQGKDKFNKGNGINAGLEKLSKKGWVIHLDADMYLPPKTREILSRLPLDKTKIYGADRLMCPNFEEWVDYLCDPGPIQDSWIYIHPRRFPVGVRIGQYWDFNAGYEPIGYFQLWNPKGSGVFEYPNNHGFADRTDVIFCKKWPREKRELLPEVLTIHLESDSEMGINWQGRKSPHFGPKKTKKTWSLLKLLKVLVGRT